MRNQPARSQMSAAMCAAVQIAEEDLERKCLERSDDPQECR